MVLPGNFSGWLIATWILCFAALQAEGPERIVITVEHAFTPEQQAWGLMGRKALPANHGMIFYYVPPARANLWMFNTFCDLSVAFIDAAGVIREIYELKAYPHLMEKLPRYKKPADLAHVCLYDPIAQFFREHSVTSSFPTSFALEMPSHWFETNGVKVGDKIFINPNDCHATIEH